MKKKIKLLLSAGVLFLLIGSAALFLGIRPGLNLTTIKINDAVLQVEIAEMFSQGKFGLMWRLYLPSDRGMIFISNKGVNVAFWMKNTFLPLSIAFVDQNNIILSIQKMKPLDTTKRYRSTAPYKYAIEVNQGWFQENNIKVGDNVVFLGSDWLTLERTK